mmetsp:Transcript_31011/g.40958  ORF Transcript_31011/g.40958 Transcript_31011/m.40958 type:complete len:143 (+) Transcript_31011:77-505(+)
MLQKIFSNIIYGRGKSQRNGLLSLLLKFPAIFDDKNNYTAKTKFLPSIFSPEESFSPRFGLEYGGAVDADLDIESSSSPLDLHIWMAVPKSKVSRSRKRKKHHRYKQNVITNWSFCDRCGKPKLFHKLCENYELCAKRDEEL